MAGHERMASMLGMPIIETPVLIIGSSMVGMTLSTLLAKHGIQDCITIERHSSTAIHPRAALFHPRTMQIYRELGLYEEMYAESLKHYDEHAGLHIVETLAGRHLGTYMKDINDGIENISPTHRLFLTQQMFEPLLRQHAIGNGAILRFSTELEDFQHHQGGVTALIRSVETGEKQIVRAKYMVACDGNRSPVREKLGIMSQGHGLLSHSLTIYFDADLGKFVKDKYNGVIYVDNEHVRGFFRLDKSGREGFLVVNTAGKKGTEESRHPSIGITDEKAGGMLRAAIGADVDFKITHLSPWNAECNVAERFNDGKIILAGDAAHVVTPHGGFGGNTGIHDAHNVAWKLALVLKGKAGEELVTKTYHEERFPVSKKTVDQVFARFVTRAAPDLFADDAEVEEEVPEPHLELGYQYHSRALTTDGLGSVTSDPATEKARPGTMAHHVLIKTKDCKDEAYPVADLLGSDFVLIAGHEGSAWLDAAKAAVKNDSTLPELAMQQLTQDNNAFYGKYGITTAGCVLVRPDGFVAWSEAKCATSGWGAMGLPDAEHTINCVLKQILCITPERSMNRASSMASADSAIALPKGNDTVPSMATEVHKRERALQQENNDLQRRLRENEERLAELRVFSELQDKMAMLAMRLDLHTVEMDAEKL